MKQLLALRKRLAIELQDLRSQSSSPSAIRRIEALTKQDVAAAAKLKELRISSRALADELQQFKQTTGLKRRRSTKSTPPGKGKGKAKEILEPLDEDQSSTSESEEEWPGIQHIPSDNASLSYSETGNGDADELPQLPSYSQIPSTSFDRFTDRDTALDGPGPSSEAHRRSQAGRVIKPTRRFGIEASPDKSYVETPPKKKRRKIHH